MEMRIALASVDAHFDDLAGRYGFGADSVRCQKVCHTSKRSPREISALISRMIAAQEHAVMLIANASRDADGAGTLHSKLLSNYREWARHLGAPAQCASPTDTLGNKVRAPRCARAEAWSHAGPPFRGRRRVSTRDSHPTIHS